jgi:hypothetical protein
MLVALLTGFVNSIKTVCPTACGFALYGVRDRPPRPCRAGDGRMTEPARDPFGLRFVSPLLIGTLLNPVNSAMIATALVPIGRDLHAGPASTALLLFLMRLRQHPPYVLLGAAIVIHAALVWWELRRGEPFLDVRMLAADRALTTTYVRYALTWLVIYSVVYGFSQWPEEGGLRAAAREPG